MTAQHTRLKPIGTLPLEPADTLPLEPAGTLPLEPADVRPPEPAGAAIAAGSPRRQPAPVLAPPPDDGEKYSYIGRNLPYLTTGLVVSAACLVATSSTSLDCSAA